MLLPYNIWMRKNNTQCSNCKVEIYRRPKDLLQNNKFCSNCVSNNRANAARLKAENIHKNYILRWSQNLECGWIGQTRQLSRHIRKYMLNKYNSTCSKCGWNEKHPIDGLPLVEINHIDGNPENCKENNLEVICPNCHSKTYNFRARNKESSRIRN